MIADSPTWRAVVAQMTQAGRPAGRRAAHVSIAEGWRLVERALTAGVQLDVVLLSDRAKTTGSSDERRVIALLEAADVRCVVAPEAAVKALTAGRTFGDLLALVPRQDFGLASLIATAVVREHRTLLVGVDVLDPGNIGALTRTAHALGACAVVWVGGTDPTHPKALRASMGSCFVMPWTHLRGDPVVITAQLRAAGWRNIATVARGGRALSARISGPAAVWMGGEAHGLPAEVVAACDAAVRIETVAGIDSLSINAAASVVLSRVPIG